MVVLGNPPYNVSSQNKNEHISGLIKEYKNDLNERKINLDDDYIKFIRFSEDLIEKNSEGIIGMITNNSFIDGITHRQMRKHLLGTFDSIYILDLHGNSKKKEANFDGSKDENVFNIMQGVSIFLFIKKASKRKGLASVYHHELYGKRDGKFLYLDNGSLENIKWVELNYKEPYYFFVPKNFEAEEEYKKGFKIDELFNIGSSGAESAKDDFIIKFTPDDVVNVNNFIRNNSDVEISDKYNIKPEKAVQVKNDIIDSIGDNIKLLYRPFDIRYTLYSPNSQGLWWRPKFEVMKHLLKNNLALLTCRQQTSFDFQHIFIADSVVERCAVSLQTGEVSYVFPLYIHSDDGSQCSNLKKEIVDDIEKIVGKITPENILDYIYAVLYSPTYREKYKEFLKIDFPRVPYPESKEQFESLVSFGKELRGLHLLESSKLNNFITTYPEIGDDIIEKKCPVYKDEKVYINDIQYFGNVPLIAWNFYIGGYQPAQKWLKDRRERKLSNEDIEHYQKIITVLVETDRIMKEIDKII